MSKKQIIAASVIILGIVGIFVFNNFSNSKIDSSPHPKEASNNNTVYILSVPNFNFEITFPAEPQFNRTDDEDFTRYTWSYVDNSPNGRTGLFVQAENNLYTYNSSQEDFIEQTAKIYGGIVSRATKDPNTSATDYEITGVYSDQSHDTETIIGRIIDVGEWTFNIMNQFEDENRYPNFVGSFKEI